jgi:hypothetical protein
MSFNYNNKYFIWSLVGLSSLGLLTLFTRKWCSYFNSKLSLPSPNSPQSSNNSPSGIEFNMVKPKSDDEKHE